MKDPAELDVQKLPKKNPYAVWFVVIAFIAPVALAYFIFYFVEVTSFTNRGEIFTPVIDIESLELKNETGELIPRNDLTYKWRIYSFVGARCDELCNKRLYDVRQVHRRLGKNAHRLIQVIVHLEKADASFTQLIKDEYPNVMNMYGEEAIITDIINQHSDNKAELRNNEIYFVDPMGNMMMRFTQDQVVDEVRFDLRKLLKASQIG